MEPNASGAEQNLLKTMQQTVAAQLRYSPAMHLPFAWLVSREVAIASQVFFKENTSLGWLSHVIAAIAGAVTLVATKSAYEDLWIQPALLQALIAEERQQVHTYRDSHINVCIGEDDSCVEEARYTANLASFASVGSLCDDPTGSDIEWQSPVKPSSPETIVNAANSSWLCGSLHDEPADLGNLEESLLSANMDYEIVEQLAHQAIWQHAAYKASAMMVVATLVLTSLSVSSYLTMPTFDFYHDERVAQALSYSAQVSAYFLSGALLPVMLAALGVTLADHWSLVASITLVSLIGWQAIVKAVDNQSAVNPYVDSVMCSAGAVLVATAVVAVDRHYHNFPSQAFNHGLNAIGAAVGYVLTGGGLLTIKSVLPCQNV